MDPSRKLYSSAKTTTAMAVAEAMDIAAPGRQLVLALGDFTTAMTSLGDT